MYKSLRCDVLRKGVNLKIESDRNRLGEKKRKRKTDFLDAGGGGSLLG